MGARNWMTSSEMCLVFSVPAQTMRNWIREGKLRPGKGKVIIEIDSLAFGLDEIKKVARARKNKPDFSRLSKAKRESLNWRLIQGEIEKAKSED